MSSFWFPDLRNSLWFTVAGFHEISLVLFIFSLLGRLCRSSDFVFSCCCCSVLQAAPVRKSFYFSRELFCAGAGAQRSALACAIAPVSQSCLERSDSPARFRLVAFSGADLDFRFLLPRLSFSSVLLFDSISAALIFFNLAQRSLAPSCGAHWSLISGLVP
jgi:hypothetical protein